MRTCLAALAALIFSGIAAADDAAELTAPFSPETRFRFVQADEARAFLGERDDFAAALGEADLRMRFGDTAADYAQRAAAEAQDWSADEIAALQAAIELTRSRFEERGVALPLPAEILLIKTTAAEEAGAGGYTRRNAIILGGRELGGRGADGLAAILAHELFHVATHHRPALRDDLYAVVGFEPCAPTFPAELEPRRVTNPDAFHLDHCITITREGEELTVTPILLLRDGAGGTGRSPLEALDIVLLAVGEDGTAIADDAGHPMLVPIDDPDYLRRIGGNTGYIIHPEEIAADNFSLLVRGAEQLPNPEILDRFAEILASR